MRNIRKFLSYLFLSAASFVSIFPFVWMIIGATNAAADITQGKMSFGSELMNNIQILSESAGLGRAFLNSTIIAVISTGLLLLISSLAGYAFEIYRSSGKNRIYTFILLTMMIPFAALMIPLYRMMAVNGLSNTYTAVIMPTIATGYMIFFFRQSTKSFSVDLMNAARVDGLNELQIFLRIYIPTMKNTYAAAGIIGFMTSWNNFLWPLIILQSNEMKTLTLSISSLSSAYYPEYGAIMVAIIVATTPTLIVFFALQRYFVEGMLGSIK